MIIRLVALLLFPLVLLAGPAAMADSPAPTGQDEPMQPKEGPSGYTQLQIDLFDVSSPGFGLWVNHVRMDPEGRPDWQLFAAAGLFNHYAPGELASPGWGHAEEQRYFVRVGGDWYPWRGLFVGAQFEFMWRRVRQRTTGDVEWGFMPAIQPAVGYILLPWGWGHGKVGLMLWIAPRIPLRRPELVFPDGHAAHEVGPVEFSSGLNLGVTL